MKMTFRIVLSVMALLLVSACGALATPTSVAQAEPLAKINSSQGELIEIAPNGQKILLWVETSINNPSYEWKLTGSGALSSKTEPETQYIAPESLATEEVVGVTVTVVDQDDPSRTASARFTIRLVPPVPAPTDTPTSTLTPTLTETPAPSPTLILTATFTFTSTPTAIKIATTPPPPTPTPTCSELTYLNGPKITSHLGPPSALDQSNLRHYSRTVKVSWNRTDCKMIVQFMQEQKPVFTSGEAESETIDATNISVGWTEIQIYVPTDKSGVPSDKAHVVFEP